jgi:hypothetical protein
MCRTLREIGKNQLAVSAPRASRRSPKCLTSALPTKPPAPVTTTRIRQPFATLLSIGPKIGIPSGARLASPRTAKLARLMPEKLLLDTSRMMLCPMSGVITTTTASEGDSVEPVWPSVEAGARDGSHNSYDDHVKSCALNSALQLSSTITSRSATLERNTAVPGATVQISVTIVSPG